MKRIAVPLLVMSLALFGAACGEDDGADVRTIGGSSGSGSGSGSAVASGSGSSVACEAPASASEPSGEIHLTLDEYSITMEEETVPTGHVKIEATNDGTEPHEVYVVRAASIDDLPTDDDGALDVDALDEGDLVGEIEPIAPGEECAQVFELEAGDHVLLCNIVEIEDGEAEAHLQEGMALEVSI